LSDGVITFKVLNIKLPFSATTETYNTLLLPGFSIDVRPAGPCSSLTSILPLPIGLDPSKANLMLSLIDRNTNLKRGMKLCFNKRLLS